MFVFSNVYSRHWHNCQVEISNVPSQINYGDNIYHKVKMNMMK